MLKQPKICVKLMSLRAFNKTMTTALSILVNKENQDDLPHYPNSNTFTHQAATKQ